MEGVIVAKIEPIGMERLEGTQTFENINRALMDEAISVVRYLIYADEAEDAMVEKFFKQTAENEMEHAKVMLKLLGALGEETDNLKKSFSISSNNFLKPSLCLASIVVSPSNRVATSSKPSSLATSAIEG